MLLLLCILCKGDKKISIKSSYKKNQNIVNIMSWTIF